MMHTVELDNRIFRGPSNWNEVTATQLITWVKLLATEVSTEIAMFIAAMHFYGIPKRTFFKLNPVQQFELTQTLNFLAVENKLSVWMIPYLNILFTRYLGPQDRLSNSTIKEFRYCEIYYNAYQRSNNEQFLDLLISTLYRPGGKNISGDDSRRSLTELQVRKNAGNMQRLSKPVRNAILFNYEGCRSFICKKYPTIFKPGDEKRNALPDMQDLIKTVAGGKFGTFHETENTALYLFLDHLRDEIEESERNKK